MKKSVVCVFLWMCVFSCGGSLSFGAVSEAGLPRAAGTPTDIWQLPVTGISEDELTTMVSLQGQIAQQGGKEQLFLTFPSDGGYEGFLDTLESDYNVTVHRNVAWKDILKRLCRYADGYIIYDKANADSLQIATMMASYMKAALVEKQSENKITELTGWSKIAEAPIGQPPQSWLATPRPELNIDAPANIKNNATYLLRDYLIMAKSPLVYDVDFPSWIQPTDSSKMVARPMFGWGNTKDRGESSVIGNFSRAGFYNIPAESEWNYSVMSAFEGDISQKAKAAGVESPITSNTSQHLVTFVLTDGDNAGFALKGMLRGGTNSKQRDPQVPHWLSERRGTVPMGWGTQPAFGELALPAQKWMYNNAANNGYNRDYFVGGPSGLGYFFPDELSSDLLAQNAKRLAKLMGKLDLKYTHIMSLGTGMFEAGTLSNSGKAICGEFLQYREIEGLIVMNYANYYLGYGGKIDWVHNKPVVSPKYKLWNERGDETKANYDPAWFSDREHLVTNLKSAATSPRNLKSKSGYTLVVVHCWSRALEDVWWVADQLKDTAGVKIVSPDVFFETLDHHGPGR